MALFIRCESPVRATMIPALVLVAGLAPSAAAAQTYTITNLGTLYPSSQDCPAADTSSTAFDVNNSGRVVGSSHSECGGLALCFRTAENQPINPMTDRLVDDGQVRNCAAYGINDKGWVVGARGFLQAVEQGKAFLYHSQMRLLYDVLQCEDKGGPNLFGCYRSVAFALNSTGDFVGKARENNESAGYHGFRLSLAPVDFTELEMLPPTGKQKNSEARAINDLNVIVGSSDSGPGGVVQRAVHFGSPLQLGDVVHDLGTLGGTACTFCSSAAYAINNVETNPNVIGPKGQVVGWSTLSVSGPRHAFFRDLGVSARNGSSGMVDLGDLCPGPALCRSAAFAINDVGEIVGESQATFGSQNTHAFVYRIETGVMEDLNHSLAWVDRVKWELTDARGINDLGQIVGTGVFLGKLGRAYRLDPPPSILIRNLDTLLEHFDFGDRSIEQSLRDRLRAIQDALAVDDRQAACAQTAALNREIREQSGSSLKQGRAMTVIAGSALLQRDLDCR
jgi:probable HAF family extracellular repeat protein